MIIASLADCARYECLHPHFKLLFDYIRSHDLSKEPAGRIELMGNDVFINVVDVTLKYLEDQKMEVHRKYLDVHIPLSGTEIIGWSSLSQLLQPSEAPFDDVNDFAIYAGVAQTYVTIAPGQFCVVYPDDAHAPTIGTGALRKLIAKVAI